MKTIFAVLILLLISVSISAQQIDLSALAKSENGKRALAYFTAFNSGDDLKLRDYFAENVAAESLKQRPVEARVETHKRFRGDLQTLEIKKVLLLSEAEIRLLAQAKNGSWIAVSFSFENQPPQKMLGMRIEQTEAPGAEEKFKYPAPINRAELLTTVENF
jgi:hypothetical protein